MSCYTGPENRRWDGGGVPQSCEGGRSVSQRTDAGRMDAASLENI